MTTYDVLGALTWGLAAACVGLLFLYLKAERRNDGRHGFWRATVIKLILSTLAAAIGLVSYNMSIASYDIRSNIYFMSLVLTECGLVCCIPGDLFLQYIRKNNLFYRIGIGCFAGAQIFFLISLILMDLLSGWLLTLGVSAAILVCVLILMRRQNWQLGPERILLTVYTVLLVLMFSRSLATLLAQPDGSTLIRCLGSGLFLISDIILGISNYASSSWALKRANWITYFAGILLIALSMSPMMDGMLLL